MKQLPFILFLSIFSVGSFATSSNLKDSLETIKKEFLLPSLSGAYLKNGEIG